MGAEYARLTVCGIGTHRDISAHADIVSLRRDILVTHTDWNVPHRCKSPDYILR